MVPQEEKVYVECNGEFFELGRCLPGQRVGSKAWYDHLGKVARDQGLQPYPANPAVFYKVGRTPLVMSSHVDDLQLVEVNKMLRSSLTASESRNGHCKCKDPVHLRLQGNAHSSRGILLLRDLVQ